MYCVYNQKQDKFYQSHFSDVETARHWVINHLNLSDEPEILDMQSDRYNQLTSYIRQDFAN